MGFGAFWGVAFKFFHDKTFRVSCLFDFQYWLPGLSILQGAPHPFEQTLRLQIGVASALSLPPGAPPELPGMPPPLCPQASVSSAFSSPAKIPGSLSQVGKWFSLTQSGNFSEPPLPLAHFLCLGRTQRAREFLSLLSVGPRVGIPTAPNI